MISKKLRVILSITLVLIFSHGLEEILSGFPFSDSWMVFFGNLFATKTEVFYWTFHIMWWVFIIVGIILLLGNRKSILILLSLFGLLYITELHHPLKALLSGQYYPGMITGLIYPILGAFYFEELLAEWRRKNE